MDSLLEAVGAALTVRRNILPPGRLDEGNQYYYYVYDPQTEQHNRGFFYWCWRFLVTLFKLAILCLISMGSYAIFYQVNQPVILHFQEFQFDYYQDQPAATVVFNERKNQWKALVDGIEGISTDSQILRPGQAYYVELALKLPESESNIASGMFGVMMELYGSSNKTSLLLATSRRSLRFPYRSSWVRAVANVISLPTLFLGLAHEAQTVKDNIFRHVLEDETYQLCAGVVKLLEPVEVVAAEVRIGEELTWFQELIRTWFWTCSLIGSTFFAAIYFVAYQIGIVWLWTFHEEPPCDLNFEEFSIHNQDREQRFSTSVNGGGTEVESRTNGSESRIFPGNGRGTGSPLEEVEVPDEFRDGGDGEWEDLSVAEIETHARSDSSIQARSMTSEDLRRYLNRTMESGEEHPFLVFMGD